MAQNWDAKSAGETVERRWRVPLEYGEAITSVSQSAAGVTVTVDHENEDVVATVSGGTAGQTANVTLTAVTTRQTLVETFYIPVRVSTTLRTVTVRDVVSFALAKVTGDGEDPTSEQMATGVSHLTEMLALYRLTGADLGLSGEMSASDTLDAPDTMLAALKWVLRGVLYAHYGAEMSAMDVKMADASERALYNATVKLADLNMSRTLGNTSNPEVI